MSVSYAPAKLKVPPGFEHLLEGLTREILRVQPKDIIAFSAEYFKKKVVLRDEGGISTQSETNQEKPRDAAEHARPAALSTSTGEDSAPHHTDEDKEQVKDVSNPALNKAATVIQSTFRGYLAREKVKDLKVTETLPREMSTETGGLLEGVNEEEKGTNSENEEKNKGESGETHVESKSGEVGEGCEDGDGSGENRENKARGMEEEKEREEDTSGGEVQVEPSSEDVAADLSGEEPVEGGSLSGEQEEQTEEHGPKVEEQEPLPEDSEGDAKALSDIELEGEGDEKLEHIAASTDEIQEMSND